MIQARNPQWVSISQCVETLVATIPQSLNISLISGAPLAPQCLWGHHEDGNYSKHFCFSRRVSKAL